MKTTAITGSTGFVGKRLVVYNKLKYRQQLLSLRHTPVDTIDFSGTDAVIHLAGKAHQMEPVPDSIYFEVNFELTKKLADKAKAGGVRQFIYISSTKVYGDDEQGPLDESSPCIPTDAYGESKFKAEQYLQSIQSNNFIVAIIRPPLVYGPEVKGHMIKLLALSGKNIPLPFGSINNQRSMVFVDNLIELINNIIDQQAGGIYIAGDRRPLSTTELVSLMRRSLNKSDLLISLPGVFRQLLGKIKPALYKRLFTSFVIDNTITNYKLGFMPPYATSHGIKEMITWYKMNAAAKRNDIEKEIQN